VSLRFPYGSREKLNIALDRTWRRCCAPTAEAHVSEGEIVDRAIRALDLRSLVARIRERKRSR